MGNNWKEEAHTLAGISSVEYLLRLKYKKGIETLAKVHPYLRLYFDSDLNSDTEINALKGISEAIVSSMDNMSEKFGIGMLRNLGVGIAGVLDKGLYYAKLLHHVNIGKLDADHFLEELSRYIACHTVVSLRLLWEREGMNMLEYLNKGIVGLCQFFNLDPNTTYYLSNMVNLVINLGVEQVFSKLTPEKMTVFVNSILKTAIKSVRKLGHFIDTSVALVNEAERRLKELGRKVCEVLNLKIPGFLKENGNQISDEIYEENEKYVEDVTYEEEIDMKDKKSLKNNKKKDVEKDN